MNKELQFTQEDVTILREIYGDAIKSSKDAFIELENGTFVFEALPNDYQTVYKNHCEYENEFDENFRDNISYEDFIKELKQGYGNSDHLQIARLFTLSCGIFYDNEYLG